MKIYNIEFILFSFAFIGVIRGSQDSGEETDHRTAWTVIGDRFGLTGGGELVDNSAPIMPRILLPNPAMLPTRMDFVKRSVVSLLRPMFMVIARF